MLVALFGALFLVAAMVSKIVWLAANYSFERTAATVCGTIWPRSAAAA